MKPLLFPHLFDDRKIFYIFSMFVIELTEVGQLCKANMTQCLKLCINTQKSKKFHIRMY